MSGRVLDSAWRWPAAARGAILGGAAGAVGLAGSSLIAFGTALPEGIIFLAVAAAAFAVGLWAGVPAALRERLSLRDRWLAAAALVAVAGAFASFSAVYQPIYPGSLWPLAALLLGLAIPFYCLGLIPPVLAAWLDDIAGEDDEPGPAWVLVGTIVVPALGGLVAALLLVGLLVAEFWTAGSILIATSLLLLLPLALPEPVAAGASETVLHETSTAYSTIRVTEVTFPGERQPERRLYINGEEESGELVRSGAPTLGYVAAAEQLLASMTPPGAAYLFLGGGAYTLPRRIAERDREAKILVVELDPEVTRVAYRFFGVQPHHRITSVFGDARMYLEAEDIRSFDRIYVDVYAGREALPHSLVTLEAALAIKRRLKHEGLLAMNVIGTVLGAERLQPWSIVQTFSEVFPMVELYTHLGRDYPDRQNLILLAATEPLPRVPANLGMFEHWPRSQWPAGESLITYRDLHPAAEEADAAARAATVRGARLGR